MSLLTISGSPHVEGNYSVKKIMYFVVLAMLPALAVSIYYFGIDAIRVTAIAVLACMLVELLIQRFIIKGPSTVLDGSAIVTGILLAFNVPSNLPAWMIIIGAIVAIGIGKMSFGGLGKNPFNPALVGRVFLLISFPVHMTSWPTPNPITAEPLVDGLTGPTALGFVKEGIAAGGNAAELVSQFGTYSEYFFGNMGGSLGEVSAIALILGGIFMLVTRVITWHIPVAFIGSSYLFALILNLANPGQFVDPVFHLLTGGLLLGAIFMATDMVSSPMSYKAQIVFGIGCGILTILIRVFGAYPEGVSFAILLMNAATPLLNNMFKPKRFGEVAQA